jgi:hypothetical protein
MTLSGCNEWRETLGTTYIAGKLYNVDDGWEIYPGLEDHPFDHYYYEPKWDPDPAGPGLSGTPPYYPFLARQANCSLTRGVSDSNATIQEQNPNYEAILHNVLQVPTTAGKFPNGCPDSGIGIASQAGAVVGKFANGNIALASISRDGVFVAVVTSAYAAVSQQGYPITGTVFGLATADLNGDGVPDMVVASEASANSGSLTVLLGKGDGTFTTGASLPITLPTLPAPPPIGVTIDDVNGDGKLDLVGVTAGTPSSSGIVVFLGNGDGTFAAGLSGPNGAGGAVAVTADFNGDGKKDIATSYGQVLLGNGDGTFLLQSLALPEGQGMGVAAADFNQDGKVDLAFTNSTPATVDIYFGNGDGTFA